MGMKSVSALAAVVGALFFSTFLGGCASGGVQDLKVLPSSEILAVLGSGDIRLSCELSCAGNWGASRRQAKRLYEQHLWLDLTRFVVGVGQSNDLAYFYLARSAESMGHTEAARTYYNLSLTARFRCDGILNNCDGISVQEAVDASLARLFRAKG